MKSAGFYTSNILTQISEESHYTLSVFTLYLKTTSLNRYYLAELCSLNMLGVE